MPVLIVAAGQLGGGLAWLAVSGEDAPDLIASAPVPPGRVLRAKTEAVLGGIAMVLAPFVAVLAIASPHSWSPACGRYRGGRRRRSNSGFGPRLGAAVSPPSDFIAARDLCGGLFVDRLGWRRSGRRH